MNFKSTLILFFTLMASGSIFAQDLTGTGSVTFDNTDPCVINLSFQYTNVPTSGSGNNHAGPFTTGIFMTDDWFTADPVWDIPVTEVANGQGCNIGDVRTVTVNNIDISQLPGFVSGTNYTIYYFLDVYEEVSERNENNNMTSLGTTICTTVDVDDAFAAAADMKLAYSAEESMATVHLNLPNAEEVTVSVVDVQGRTVVQAPAAYVVSGAWQQRLNVQHLPAGIYHVRVLAGDQVFGKKLMIF